MAIAKEVEVAKGPEIEDDEVEFLRADDEDMEGAELSETQKRKAEREARGQAVIDRRQKELDDLVTAAGVIWIMQIRFARRTDVSTGSESSTHVTLTRVFRRYTGLESCTRCILGCKKVCLCVVACLRIVRYVILECR